MVQFLGRLDRAQAFERELRLDELRLRQSGAQHALGVGGQEGALDADAFRFRPERRELLDRELHSVGAGARRRVEGRDPESVQLPLIILHRMPNIGRALRMALRIDEERQIAADADRVEMVEEEEPVSAEQILDVVFRRHDQRVDAGFLHQFVETAGVERRRDGHPRRCAVRVGAGSFARFHVLLP